MSLLFLKFACKYGPLTSETALREANIIVTKMTEMHEGYFHRPKYMDIYRALRAPYTSSGDKWRCFTEIICS